MSTGARDLLLLQSWLSPAFPVGGYAYSHGIEYAVQAGLVVDRAGLVDWLDTLLRHGAGLNDGVLLAAAWRAAEEGDMPRLARLRELSAAFRGSAELGLESSAQGAAFLLAVRAAWPHPQLERCMAESGDAALTLPFVVGVACAAHGIALGTVLPLYLQAFAAQLVNAAVRLVPLGQSEGLRAVAALEGAIAQTSAAALLANPEDLGGAALVVDWTSISHERQHTRLFRS